MYEVVIFDGQGRRIAIDFHALTLDDGSKAFDYVEPSILYQKLKKMAVPEIAANMGKHDLLLCLGRYLAAQPKQPPVHRRAAS